MGGAADWVAGLATLAAVVVALRGYKFAEWQRQQALREERRKHVHLLGTKLAEMSNDAWAIALHFKECLDRNPKSKTVLPRVFPLIGDSPPDRFLLSLDETAILIESNNAEFMTTYSEAVRAQIIIHRTMEEYRHRYDALRAVMPTPVDVVGIAHTYDMTNEQIRAILPSANLLNDLLAGVADIIRTQTSRCAVLCSQYHGIFKASFPNEKFIALEMPEEPVIPPIVRQPGWADRTE